MIKNISNLGDAALYCDFGNEVNKSINSQVIKYFKTIKEKKFNGINNLTPSYNKLIISYDLKKTNFKEVKSYVENIDAKESIDIDSKKLEIPVCCHENFSLDIKRLEDILKLSREKILENLSAILKVPMKKIGLKATTSEKIGIIGNNEAISVQSIVNLKDLS